MEKIAIIGIGCAGYHCIKALREQGYTGEIHVYSDQDHPTANPMLTTYYVADRIPRDRMFPFGSLAQLEADYQVCLHMQTPVSRVIAADHSLLFADGSVEAFDKILISTGARAVSPRLGQRANGRAFLMRTVSEADALKEMLTHQTVRSATVVGASMVGIKIVELLLQRGVHVSMVDMADRLFPLACMQETADILENDLQTRGIDLYLKHGVDHIEESDSEISTFLTDGKKLTTDLVVLCIGTRANVELVANTEVVENEPIQVNRGIVVNNKMQTNIPGIYAAGDCCEGLNVQTGKTMIIGLWANAAAQGETAGCNMAGKNTSYPGSIPNNITHYFDQNFIGIGDPNLPGERYVHTDKNGTVAAIHENGKLKCVNILGNYRISGMVKEYLLAQITGSEETLTVSDAGLLRASGVPADFIELLGGKK